MRYCYCYCYCSCYMVLDLPEHSVGLLPYKGVYQDLSFLYCRGRKWMQLPGRVLLL
jgi:hypothetical protein